MTGRGFVQDAFEQERQEAIEGVLAGLAEKPEDHVTRMACAYLLRHLHAVSAADHFTPMAA